jgi:uncharacterized membrane protein
MTLTFLKRGFRKWFAPRARRPIRRLHLEPLEERILLDASLPPSIVVGRTLSSYFAGGIQNNQETITYTVYNEQANPETGVLLTDTLEPGVTIQTASQLPDQSGQKLAWSLGTIQGYDRASVTLTVALDASLLHPAPTSPLQLDIGARAFAMLEAGAVSDSTISATVRPGNVSDPSLLASTPDANTTDPYVQEAAAKLNYDPQQIFDFLHNDIGYNSYVGSLRGARGTLWSSAGNALDVASLGVALMRASGIPAQYVAGTLSQSQAQQLILSMFPASYQTVGYIPAGTQTSDPANDPQLLSETESHYWFQLDFGSGFLDADPLMRGATIGQTFATSTRPFTEVPDDLREKTEVQLAAEFYGQASALITLSNGLSQTIVLDHTFNDVELVGRPITIGNFVNSSTLGFIVTETANTYTPYLDLGDEAFPDPGQDEIITGTPYQEVLSNFALSSKVLTGLFLNTTLSGPQRPAETDERALVDHIGDAARQGFAPVSISVSPGQAPTLNQFDLWTFNVQPALQNPNVLRVLAQENQTLAQELQIASGSSVLSPRMGAQGQRYLTNLTRYYGASYLYASDVYTNSLGHEARVVAYSDRPRLVLTSVQLTLSNDQKTATLTERIDLRRDSVRAIAAPGQNVASAAAFNTARGLLDNYTESNTIQPQPPSNGLTVATPVSTLTIFQAAAAQQIPIAKISSANLSQLDALAISAEARARITTAIGNGKVVFVPNQSVQVNGTGTDGWYELDPNTGEITGVTSDGGHELTVEQITQLFLVAGVVSGLIALGLFIAHLAHIQVPSNDSNGPNQSAGVAGHVPGFSDATKALHQLDKLSTKDPPLDDLLFDVSSAARLPITIAPIPVTFPIGFGSGEVVNSAQVQSIQVSGTVSSTWSNQATSSLTTRSLNAGTATISNAEGNVIGSGQASFSSANAIPISVSGSVSYSITGTGSLSFYGQPEASLGVSGEWDNYSVSVTGNVSIALTVPDEALTLNGNSLPAGTYTITTKSATLFGSGDTTAPDFAGSASITPTNGTVNLGAGSGNVTVGGNTLDVSSGATLDGYTGSLTVAAGDGNNLDEVTLNANAANVLTISATPNTLTTDQNTPVTFQANVNTNLADTYNLTAQAPPGWTVTIDSKGNVTATPAPGLQSGSYPIQIIAQSTTDSNLVAQTTVNVTITPTLPAISFSVASDPIFTVPFNGTQLPTAFRASIQNLGPAADTYNLTFSNLPTGFTLLNSGTSVTVPAGQTGILGLYLQPTAGQPLPAPGTPLSFTVTATSTTDPSITQTQTVSFTMPQVDAVTVTNNPVEVSTTPGTVVEDFVTFTNVGNVPEKISATASAPTGLTIGGINPFSATLAVGQSITSTAFTLTPDGSTPLNTTLTATVTTTYGPAASPQTQTLQVPVQVVVPGAQALANAAVTASQLGETDLANRLTDLSTALANLVQDPTSAIYRSQALANLDTLINLINADPFLSADDGLGLAGDRTALAAATTAAQVQAPISRLGGQLGSLALDLSNVAAHRFTLSLTPNTAVALPGAPATFDLFMQNTGSEPTTYDFSVTGLPSSVQAVFSQSSITLQPGQDIPEGANRVTLSLSESGIAQLPVAFTVVAQAEQKLTSYPDVVLNVPGSLTVRASFVQVTNVNTNPPFAQPGASDDVSASVLNVVNQPQTVLVSYTVVDPSGVPVFTSTPVSAAFDLKTSFTTLDLGSFNTAGFALGTYQINVSVTDPTGHLIPGGTGQANLFLGSPVTASLSVAPTTAVAGLENPNVTNTLQINSQISFPAPLTQIGQVNTTPTGLTMAVDGNLAYIAGTSGIDIVDITDPTNPQLVATFAQKQILPDGFSVIRLDSISGADYLVVGTTATVNPDGTHLLIYSLADPKNPSLLSSTKIPYVVLYNMLVQGDTVLVLTGGIAAFVQSFIYDQLGTVLGIDVSNPAAPIVGSALFNGRGTPNGGYTNQDGGTLVNNQLAYIASTTSTGSGVQQGTGRVLVVDYSNPDNLSLLKELDIPGTLRIEEIALQGNLALVLGSTGGWSLQGNGTTGFAYMHLAGHLTLTLLDVTDPQNPQILGITLVTDAQFPTSTGGLGTKLSAVGLDNGLFAVSGVIIDGNPVLLVVDPSNPQDIVVAAQAEPAVVNQMVVSAGLLYAPSAAGLTVYRIGTVPSIPLTISVNVPKNSQVSTVPSSFPIPPTQIITGTNSDTLVWERSLAFGDTSTTLTWQSQLANLNPGVNTPVTLGGTVDFVSQGTAGVIVLPPTNVVAQQVATLTPSSQTVQPGATATYDVHVQNLVNYNGGYSFTVQGLPSSWVNISSSPLLSPGESADVPLKLTPPTTATPGTYQFVLVASSNAGQEALHASLTVAGLPISSVDPEAHGIVAALTPAQASAGQGTAAQYTIQLTNTGSADDTFSLATSGLPAGITAGFSQNSIDVPPGISNFRDVTLTLTAGSGTPPNAYSFQVQTTSTTDASITTSAAGTLTVVAQGVQVAINPPTASPGSSLQMTVTNTGTVQDTFDLSLGGPAALVSSLGGNKATLAPGASQVVPITTSAVNFAVQGSLGLTAMAQSEGNAAVEASASAALTIPATTGLTAQLNPSTQTLQVPGTSSFLLLVNNTGNTDDAYTATITGTNGPITGTLMGLDGQPTLTIPLFRLPGLSTGAILLQTNTPNAGQGTVTVQVNSLNNPANTASETATVDLSPEPTTTTVSSDHASGSTYGQTVTFTATVDAAAGTSTGSVQFQIDGSNSGSPVTLTNGSASLTANLPAGRHKVTAFYTSDTDNFTTSDNSASPWIQTVNPTALTITADNQSMVYGGALPALTASYSGLVNGDTPASFSVSPNVAPALATVPANSHAGSDPITISGAVDPNYSISYASGTLTIAPAPLTITADDKTKAYGAPLPSLTASYSGFVNGDSAASFMTQPTLTSTATASSVVVPGGYPITASGAVDPDYTVTYVPGTLTITALSQVALSGSIFFDFNANGRRDRNDPGLAGRTIYLDLNNDAKRDAGDPRAVTGADGSYQFTGLTAGTYTVREDLPYGNVALTNAAAGQTTASSATNAAADFGVVLFNPAYPVYPQPDLWGPHPNNDANTAYVRGLYRTVLHRDAEPAGLAYWLAKLASGSTQTQVAWGIINSVEHRRNEVDAFYQTLLDRAPDAASASWVDMLQRDGNEAEVIEGIASSAEFTATHASNAAFVADLYRRLLGREADQDGDVYWQHQLARGMSRSAVAAGFLDSVESADLAAVANYAAFLQRPGDVQGQAYWVQGLSSRSITFSQLAMGFLASREFEFDATKSVF